VIDASVAARADIAESTLSELVEVFGLGEVRERRYLADGLMNANWRLETSAGRFALKRVTDVSLDRLQSSLEVLGSLGADGVPVSAPVSTVSGAFVAEDGGGVWCLFPWVDGSHVRGVDLGLSQVASLGANLGRLHVSLGRACGQGLLPGVPETIAAEVTSPEQAVEKAARLSAAVRDKGTGSDFDRVVATALEDRQELVAKQAGRRPKSSVPLGTHGWTHGDFQYLH
jgi:hypothetical protein